MTILFAGNEDICGLTYVGTAALQTSSNAYRSSFSRVGHQASNSTTVADPPANRITLPTFTAGSTVWFHAMVVNGNNASTNNQQALILRSPDAVSRIILRNTGTAGVLKASSRNSAGTITDLATATAGFLVNTPVALDLYVDYTASPGGIQLYIGGVQVINYVGDPRTDAATQLYQVEMSGITNQTNPANGNGSTNMCGWSEMIVADADTRSMALWTLVPQAAGNTQSFTPNTVGNISEATLSDATFVSTGNNNDLSQWTTPTTAPSGVWLVKSIVQNARAQVGVTGPQHFDWSVRTSSTDYLAGTSNAPGVATFSNFSYIWATNPNTSSAWVIGNIAAGFNLGIKSLA